MIRVFAGPDTCLARVRSRSSADHILVSDGKVVEYNGIAAAVSYEWDLEINNRDPLSEADLLAAIRQLWLSFQ